MIAAVEEGRPGHRQRTRSAASDAVFSLPALPSIADMLPFNPPPSPAGAPVCAPVATPPAPDLSGFLGRSVGSGQCVALVRAAQPALGASSTWTQGAAVRGNTALPPGTPIATFTDGSYANATDGSSHAAIYLGQDATGVQVLDQWLGSAASVRTIPWSHPGAAAANTGAAFCVVKPPAA